VGLVQSDQPLSFVWGFGRAKLVVSTGLLTTLTPEELAAVLEHEAAHHARRDNLSKLGLTMCAHATLAVPLARRLLRWRDEQVELICDETAARSTSPLDLADALVKVRRHALRVAVPALASSFVPENDGAVEERVRRLVMLDDVPASGGAGTAPRHVLPWASAILLVVSAGILAFAPLGVHTTTEAIFRVLK
jgi:Zn-dependent protease with chaperone function